MVQEWIVPGYKVSCKNFEADKPKIEVIEKMSTPNIMKGVRSFLGHARSYRRFVKDLSV